MMVERIDLAVDRVTDGPYLHFFGYYDKCPWDSSGRYLLAMRVAFMDRPPTPQDIAVVGYVDLQNGRQWHPIGETTAWCWQQGSMLQWMPSASDREVIYNTITQDGFGAAVVDIRTGVSRTLPRPIYALAPDGKAAVTLNFSRVHYARPGYGYAGVPDPWASQLAPQEDGIHLLDLETGRSQLIISLSQMANYAPESSMEGAIHWFNHLQFNTTGSRFLFLHRWRAPDSGSRRTRMFTANPDGSGICFLGREGMVSHFDWRDEEHILAWSTHDGENHYHLYRDRSPHVQVIGKEVLHGDGHCSYSPDRRWILTDLYPDPVDSKRTLILYQPQTDRRLDIGRFYSAPEISGEIRCDLHPRWNRSGTQVCFDSMHEGERQIYVVDVSPPVS